MQQRVQDYFTTLGELPLRSIVTDARGRDIDMASFFEEFGDLGGGYVGQAEHGFAPFPVRDGLGGSGNRILAVSPD